MCGVRKMLWCGKDQAGRAASVGSQSTNQDQHNSNQALKGCKGAAVHDILKRHCTCPVRHRASPHPSAPPQCPSHLLPLLQAGSVCLLD